MIKHHPQEALLLAHAKGELPLSMAIAVSAHCTLCAKCNAIVAALTEQEAEATLSAGSPEDRVTASETDMTLVPDPLPRELQAMLAHIFSQPEANVIPSHAPISLSVKTTTYSIPAVFRQHLTRPWQQLGKVCRMRFDVDELNTRASLLHIDALGEIPQHTHKGYELTLLLAGEFTDINGEYVPGDFILLDNQTHHAPKTKTGCLCYTVLDAPLHFTKGLSKLLNPIGELIY